jgi:cbb3-type cytochrome oxidase subunit 3
MPLAPTCAEEATEMTYDIVAHFSQVTSLLLFIGLFAIIVGYVLIPANKVRLEQAQRRALGLDRSDRDGSRS